MRSWVIGSRADCDVVVDSPLASGRHCQLTQTPDGLVLEDLGSTNGTYVDGNRITAATRDHARPGNHPRPDRGDAVAVRTGEVRPDRPGAGQRHRARRPQGLEPACPAHDRGRIRCFDRGPRLLERHLSEFGRLPSDAADAAFEIRHGLLRKSGGSGRSTPGRLARDRRAAGARLAPPVCRCAESPISSQRRGKPVAAIRRPSASSREIAGSWPHWPRHLFWRS